MSLIPSYQNNNMPRKSIRWQTAPRFQQPLQNNIRPSQSFQPTPCFQPQVIDTDVSMGTVGTTQNNVNGQRNPIGSAQVPNNTHRVYHLSENQAENNISPEELQVGIAEHIEEDQLNFLDIGPSYPMWKGNSEVENFWWTLVHLKTLSKI